MTTIFVDYYSPLKSKEKVTLAGYLNLNSFIWMKNITSKTRHLQNRKNAGKISLKRTQSKLYAAKLQRP